MPFNRQTTWVTWLALLAAIMLAPGTHCWHGFSHWLGVRHSDCQWQFRLRSVGDGENQCVCHVSINRVGHQTVLEGLSRSERILTSGGDSKRLGSCLICETYLHAGLNQTVASAITNLGVFCVTLSKRCSISSIGSFWPPPRGPPHLNPVL